MGAVPRQGVLAYDSDRAGDKGNMGFETFEGPCLVNGSMADRLMSLGPICQEALITTNNLLADALTGAVPNMQWLIDTMFASVPHQHHKLAADAVIASRGRPIPQFRPDVLEDGSLAEIQVPGSGWGFILGLELGNGVDLQDSRIIQAFRRWLGDRKGVWWLYNDKLTNSVNFLAEMCQMAGVNLHAVTTEDFDPNDPTMDVVVKRPPLPQLLSSDKGRALIRRWKAGQVEMSPPPTMPVETKHIMALVHDPSTAGFYAESARTLSRPSIIIRSGEQIVDFGQGPQTLFEALNPNSGKAQRPKFVLKYAGAREYDRFGGHQVYALPKSGSWDDIRALLARAIGEWQVSREAWILQPFVSRKHTAGSVGAQGPSGKHYLLYRPSYQCVGDQGTELVATLINMRKQWKVHGSSDTWFGVW